jgi:hypothetical protein
VSLPPLPETFGNYAIPGIAEVLSPEPVSWVPSTIGWRVLGAAILLGIFFQGYRRYSAWRRDRYRRLALSELDRLRELEPALALAPVARILKSTALAAFPRTEVAALTGERWLDWLQAATDAPVFSEISRELLIGSQYREAPEVDGEKFRILARDCETWIRQHRGAAP